MKDSAGIPREIEGQILGALPQYRRQSVVSVNRVVATVRENCPPDVVLDDAELVRCVKEAAALLGLVPVYDPKLKIERTSGLPSFRD